MLKDNVLYHVFRVFEYKGGELRTKVNMNKESFLSDISDVFESAFYHVDDEVSELEVSKILELLKKEISKKGFYSTYAGGEGFVGKLYYAENGKLIEINLKDTLEDLAEYIKKNWD